MVKIICSYIAIFFAALLTAVTYEMFVFPNHFAPAGINGICTMVQYVSGFHLGYMSLLINIPLALWCLFKVSRPMSIRSLVFICFVSICLFATEALGIQSLAYSTNTGTSTLLGPIIGGIIMACLGIIGEYLARIYEEVKGRPVFIVDETNIEK